MANGDILANHDGYRTTIGIILDGMRSGTRPFSDEPMVRPVVAEQFGNPRDHLLADFAGEVDVDVRDRGQLLVEEPADVEVVGQGIDGREADQVADDRASPHLVLDSRDSGSARGSGSFGTAFL